MGYTLPVYPGGAQVFTYTLDAMERPTGMTDNMNLTYASGATYNAANQPLNDGTGTRTYNNLLQVTSMAGLGMNMTYNYSSNQNNGQIASSVDAVTGETITYQYDALKRLQSASGKNWGETYAYDGYGNLTQMNPSGTAGAPALSVNVALDGNNVPTNRIAAAGVSYDNNGNQTAGLGGVGLAYDVANRVSAVTGGQGPWYAYDSDNRRIYRQDASGTETIYFYGVDGKKVATYTIGFTKTTGYLGDTDYTMQLNYQSSNVYFLGRLIWAEGSQVTTDRLGSVRNGGVAWPGSLGYQAQYPYGVEYTPQTVNDREKYATYTRDSTTGLDYAMNRYYSSQWGRFLSPDPYGGSGYLTNPGSLNRYAYVTGDPANGNDPSGQCADVSAGITQNPDQGTGQQIMLYAAGDSAVSAFPYAGQGMLAGLNEVQGQSSGNQTPATGTFESSVVFAMEASQSGTITLFLFSGSAQAANTDFPPGEQQDIDYVVYVSPGFGTGQSGNILRGTKGTYWISNPSSANDANANEGNGTQLPLAGVTYLETGCDHDFYCTMTSPIIDPRTGQNFNKNNSFFGSVSGGACKDTETFTRPGYVSPSRGGGSNSGGRVIGDPFGWACFYLYGPFGCPTLPSE